MPRRKKNVAPSAPEVGNEPAPEEGVDSAPPPKAEKAPTAKIWMRKGDGKEHVPVGQVDDYMANGFEFCDGLVAVYNKGVGKSVPPEEAVALLEDGWSDTPVK